MSSDQHPYLPTYTFEITPPEGVQEFTVNVGAKKLALDALYVRGQCSWDLTGYNSLQLTCSGPVELSVTTWQTSKKRMISFDFPDSPQSNTAFRMR